MLGIAGLFVALELFEWLLLFPVIMPLLEVWLSSSVAPAAVEAFEAVASLAVWLVFANFLLLVPVDRVNRGLVEANARATDAAEILKAEVKEREHIESELRREKEFTDMVIESLTGLFFVYDSSRRLIRWNKNHETLTGFSADELRHKGALDWFSNEDRQVIASAVHEVYTRGETTVEARLVSKSGALIPFLFSARSIRYGDETIMAGVGIDRSRLQSTEEERARLAAVVEQASELICISDAAGIVQYVNPAFCSTTGFTPDDVVGLKCSTLEPHNHVPEMFTELWARISSGRTWRGQLVETKKDGTRYHEDVSITPITDAHGATVSYVVVKRDITEEIRIAEQLRQAQKMQSIGTLSAGIAHDFNNILGGIMGYAELGLEDARDLPRAVESIQHVLAAAHRAKDLVAQILAFSRPTRSDKKTIRITPMVREVSRFIRSSLPASIEIREELLTSEDWIMANPTEIHQVLMNLCTNAAHAMEHHGTLTLRLDSIQLSPADTFGRLRGGSHLRLSVSDTGNGIPPDHVDRIFDPYFTTKEKDEGTGLGLSVVHGIIREHGGEIGVSSVVGEGSVFEVWLPQVSAMTPIQTDDDAGEIPSGTESVLVVDDEQRIVGATTMLLERLGYSVRGATGPQEALDIIRVAEAPFDLVVTDMTMPGMTGLQLADAVRGVHPGTLVLFCSGSIESKVEHRLSTSAISGFIRKPYSARELGVAVREILDR